MNPSVNSSTLVIQTESILVEKTATPNEESQCIICLEPLEIVDELPTTAPNRVITLECTHKFHRHCINMWEQKINESVVNDSRKPLHGGCPLCRMSLGGATRESNPNTQGNIDSHSTTVRYLTHINFREERRCVMWLAGINTVLGVLQLLYEVSAITVATFLTHLIGLHGAVYLRIVTLLVYLLCWIVQFFASVYNFIGIYLNTDMFIPQGVGMIFVFTFDSVTCLIISKLVRKIYLYRRRVIEHI
mgnify:CR=1 FL=1